MRNAFVTVLLTFLTCNVMSQDADRERQAQEVKNAVAQIAGSKKAGVRVIRHDLREVKGKLVKAEADSFIVQQKKGLRAVGGGSQKPLPSVIKYGDVLQLEGPGLLLSYVPHPMSSPFPHGTNQELSA